MINKVFTLFKRDVLKTLSAFENVQCYFCVYMFVICLLCTECLFFYKSILLFSNLTIFYTLTSYLIIFEESCLVQRVMDFTHSAL